MSQKDNTGVIVLLGLAALFIGKSLLKEKTTTTTNTGGSLLNTDTVVPVPQVADNPVVNLVANVIELVQDIKTATSEPSVTILPDNYMDSPGAKQLPDIDTRDYNQYV